MTLQKAMKGCPWSAEPWTLFQSPTKHYWGKLVGTQSRASRNIRNRKVQLQKMGAEFIIGYAKVSLFWCPEVQRGALMPEADLHLSHLCTLALELWYNKMPLFSDSVIFTFACNGMPVLWCFFLFFFFYEISSQSKIECCRRKSQLVPCCSHI